MLEIKERGEAFKLAWKIGRLDLSHELLRSLILQVLYRNENGQQMEVEARDSGAEGMFLKIRRLREDEFDK